MRSEFWAAFIAGTMLAAPAWASFTVTFDGALTPDATWNRPNGMTGSTASGRPFEATAFHVAETGTYAIRTAFPFGFDGYLFLYQNSFDPTQPLIGRLGFSDFGNPEVINFLLNPDTQYFAVASSFGTIGTSTINYRHTFSGPGAITLGSLPSDDPVTPGIPEPASWAMLIAGFGLVGAIQRRRRLVRA